jgi:hypothetical protein
MNFVSIIVEYKCLLEAHSYLHIIKKRPLFIELFLDT